MTMSANPRAAKRMPAAGRAVFPAHYECHDERLGSTMNDEWTRRKFLARTSAAAAGTALPTSTMLAALLGPPRLITANTAGAGKGHNGQKKVIVIGVDGMDPRLCEKLMAANELPALSKLRELGSFGPLGTSIPPQSPVAWANFITGAGPGVHGIFDFIHRRPEKQYRPYFAAAETIVSEEGWEVGEHRIPLTFWPFSHAPTQTLLRREGTPFWDYLDEAGVPMWIYDIPSNYPPSRSTYGNVRCLAGMGTPDLLGGYGTYQHFSEDTVRSIKEGGGMRKRLVFRDGAASAVLMGPENTALKKPVRAEVGFKIHRHAVERCARIDIQDRTIVLKEGEWSDWCKIEYEMEMPSFLPNSHVSGICRFYLQEVHPNFRLYVSPINIDPSDPGDQRITEPPDFVTEISDELDLFYTTGFQEDHKALSNGIFTDEEFRQQADYVLAERMNLLEYALDHYDDGFLFFYFSSTDLQSHMFWWDSDDEHPVRSADGARWSHGVVEDLYKRIDSIVGDLMERYAGQATIIVMSDHGFANFSRQFNLNTWLRKNGYIRPASCKSLLADRRHPVDWRHTKAYGLGINALYLNLAGRERDGIVTDGQRDALLDEISEKLLAFRDPLNGKQVIAGVYRTDRVYSGPCTPQAPDLIVGYRRGYRASWGTALGDMHESVISDNDSAWSADHCTDVNEVPGVIFSNRPVLRENPALVDLAPTILGEFGLPTPTTMTGRDLFKSAVAASGAGGR